MKIGLALVAAALAIATPALAAPVIIGLPGDADSGNCYPFGCGIPSYQQVYAAGDFAGVTKLTSITFYNTRYDSGGTNAPGIFDLHLSTTSKTVDGLSSTFADNLGPDNTLVFSGTVSTPAFGGSFTLVFRKAFIYTPANGSLLLDVTTTTPNDFVAVYADTSTDATKSRLYNYAAGPTGFTSATGLVTGFNVTGGTVPEPASWVLMIAGFGLVGTALRRRPVAAAA